MGKITEVRRNISEKHISTAVLCNACQNAIQTDIVPCVYADSTDSGLDPHATKGGVFVCAGWEIR